MYSLYPCDVLQSEGVIPTPTPILQMRKLWIREMK